jgi:hypothetical protein
MRTIILLVMALFSAPAIHAAEFKLGALFQDHMVLQREMAVPVWGWAESGAVVSVEFAGQKKTVTVVADPAMKAGQAARWMVKLDPMPANDKPQTMTVTSSIGNRQVAISNVLVGDVWICSGQSNMDRLVKLLQGRYQEEVAAANDIALRLGRVGKQLYAARPLDHTEASWQPCTSAQALEFSAVALFFGLKLREQLKVPIGLVQSARGGSPVEAWMSEETLRKEFPEFNAALDPFATVVKKTGGVFNDRKESVVHGIVQRTPTVFYNAHIRPLIPFGIRGVIWYQGESNVGRAEQYARLFPAMIRQWRSEWGQGDFPFYFVQIAPCDYKDNSGALLREAQMKTLSVANTGMAVIMDLGEAKNIHPFEKKPVGERLALLALANEYGRKDLVYSGPVYARHSVEDHAVRLHFDHLGGGLAARDGKALTHFTIAGADKKFVEAAAIIEGDTIVVSSPAVERPVAVRFAFGSADIPNLMNKAGLPASSFRTDNWQEGSHLMNHKTSKNQPSFPMNAKKIVSSYTNEFRKPPKLTPRDRSVDGPLLGNGDMGVVIGGTPSKLQLYLCKNDFWRLQHQARESCPLPLGHLSIAVPGLEGASYHVTQDLYTGTTKGVFEKGAGRVTVSAYVSARSNHLVLELSADGTSFEGTVSLRVKEGRNSENDSGKTGHVFWGKRAFTKGVDLPTGAAAAWKWLHGQTPTADGSFVLSPGRPRSLVLTMESLFKHERYVEAAIASAEGIAEPSGLRRAHEAWWADYWEKSCVSIGDPVLEKHYYLSLYTMGSCSRDIDFPPPLYGWTTDDNPLCSGDYHLNYNHQAPFYGLARANRLEQADPHDTPFLDFMDRAAWHCKALYGHDGGIYPVGIGPKGIEVSYNNKRYIELGPVKAEHGGLFFGQRTDGSYGLVNMAPRWYSTYDEDYGKKIYPFVLLMAAFWENYVTWDGTRFVIKNDSVHEGSGPNMNSCLSLALCRLTLELALDMSRHLGRDAGRRDAWEHILKHLSEYTFQQRSGKTVFRYTEQGPDWWDSNTLGIQQIYPAGDIHLDSDPELIEVTRNTIEVMGRWRDFNGSSSFFPAAVRIGYDPHTILRELRGYVAECRPNGFFQERNMHAIENCSTVPNTINEMLCMDHKGVIRLFPVWPKEKDATFANLRCWGAFLVSGALKDGLVQDVAILSEKGRDCTVVNPWAPEAMQLIRNGKAAECLAGERVTFGTKKGEIIGLMMIRRKQK